MITATSALTIFKTTFVPVVMIIGQSNLSNNRNKSQRTATELIKNQIIENLKTKRY